MNTSRIERLNNDTINTINATWGLIPKLHKGTYTRAYSCTICALAIINEQGHASVSEIDDLCFRSFGHPLSVRKYTPLKTKGGAKLLKRVIWYLKGDKTHAAYSENVSNSVYVDTELYTVFPIGEFSDSLQAVKLAKQRRKTYVHGRERSLCIKHRKKVLIKSDLKKISRATAIHLHQG